MKNKIIGKAYNYIKKLGTRANFRINKIADLLKPDDVAYFKADGTPVIKKEAKEFKSIFTRDHSTFSGVDMKVIFEANDKKQTIGTIQSFSYQKEITDDNKVKMTGVADFICFDPIEDWLGKEVRLISYYCNEYGKLGLILDEKIKFIKKTYGISVDDIISIEHYTFVGTLNETVEEHIERIKNQNKKYLEETKKEYSELLKK